MRKQNRSSDSWLASIIRSLNPRKLKQRENLGYWQRLTKFLSIQMARRNMTIQQILEAAEELPGERHKELKLPRRALEQ